MQLTYATIARAGESNPLNQEAVRRSYESLIMVAPILHNHARIHSHRPPTRHMQL